MAKGPVLQRRKQRCSAVLRPNWNAAQWPRVFGINMTSRAKWLWPLCQSIYCKWWHFTV